MMLIEKSPTVFLGDRFSAGPKRSRLCLSGFEIISPRFRSSQKALLHWLSAAHGRSGTLSRDELEILFARYGASSDQIAYRGHELADFTHERWEAMRLFGGNPSTIRQKTEFYDQSVDAIFDQFYPLGKASPQHLIHVSCTGYSAPSGAQRLVSARQWGEGTEVLHAYHMGCYAAHPALRMAAGLLALSRNPQGSVDMVHTELCSLHLDPANHDPAHLVIQSLFADGFIKYQAGPWAAAQADQSPMEALEVLAVHDIIVPDSTQAMRWSVGPFIYDMELSKDVPVIFAGALPRFVASLFQEAGLDYTREKQAAAFAIHPGGPRIIELSERILGLRPEQAAWSRAVLRDHGNMSSATLPHIWRRMLQDRNLPAGALIVSIGAGPGLTLSGALFRKHTENRDARTEN